MSSGRFVDDEDDILLAHLVPPPAYAEIGTGSVDLNAFMGDALTSGVVTDEELRSFEAERARQHKATGSSGLAMDRIREGKEQLRLLTLGKSRSGEGIVEDVFAVPLEMRHLHHYPELLKLDIEHVHPTNPSLVVHVSETEPLNEVKSFIDAREDAAVQFNRPSERFHMIWFFVELKEDGQPDLTEADLKFLDQDFPAPLIVVFTKLDKCAYNIFNQNAYLRRFLSNDSGHFSPDNDTLLSPVDAVALVGREGTPELLAEAKEKRKRRRMKVSRGLKPKTTQQATFWAWEDAIDRWEETCHAMMQAANLRGVHHWVWTSMEIPGSLTHLTHVSFLHHPPSPILQYLWASAQRSSASDKVLLSIQAGMAQYVATVTMQLSPIRITSATRWALHRLILRDILSIWNIEDPNSVLTDTNAMNILASTEAMVLAQEPFLIPITSLMGVIFTPGAVAWLMQTVADLTLVFERLWWFVHDSARGSRAEFKRELLLGARGGNNVFSKGSNSGLDYSRHVNEEMTEKESRKWWKLGFGDSKFVQKPSQAISNNRFKLVEDDVKTIAETYMSQVQPKVAVEIREYIKKFEIRKAFKKDAAMAAVLTIIEKYRFCHGC